MDAYERYIFEMNKGDFTIAPAATATAAEDEYTIDKTYAQLKAMYDKGNLHGLKWHLEDGTVVMVPLTSAEADAFVFSTTIGADVHVFTMTAADELVYGTVAAGAGGSKMQVADVGGDGKPDVADPDPSTVYLTPGASSSDPYTRWVYSNGTWTSIGTTSVDLTDYYTKADIDAMPTVAYHE